MCMYVCVSSYEVHHIMRLSNYSFVQEATGDRILYSGSLEFLSASSGEVLPPEECLRRFLNTTFSCERKTSLFVVKEERLSRVCPPSEDPLCVVVGDLFF